MICYFKLKETKILFKFNAELGGDRISISSLKPIAHLGAVATISLFTLIGNSSVVNGNEANKNEVLVESNTVKEVHLADNKLAYSAGRIKSEYTISIGLDSLDSKVHTQKYKVLNARLSSQSSPIELRTLGMVAEDDDESEEDDSEVAIQSTEDEATVEETEVEERSIEEVVEETEPEEVEQKKVEQEPAKITLVDQSEALLEIAEPQESYTGAVVSLSPDDRYVLEHLVMGEAGNQGYEGAALVAQCIRDTMVYDGIPTVEQVRVEYKYSGHLDTEPNQNVLDAVSFIFDNGGIAVKHKIQYFYAPRLCNGTWHETQNFVIEYGGHKFFSKWE